MRRRLSTKPLEAAASTNMEEKLTEKQFASLKQWQARMVSLFAAFWIYFLGVIVLSLRVDLLPIIKSMLYLLLLGLVGLGAAVQFSQKCPACGYRLGRQTRLLLPQACVKCGVVLKSG